MGRSARLAGVCTGVLIAAMVAGVGARGRGAPQGQAAQAARPEADEPGGGSGRGGGRGRGGPGRDDPANAGVDYSSGSPVVALTPEQQAERFWLPQGFVIEPVLTDPDIQEPGQIAFDGNGRMFVAEIRGYMRDLDATGQLDPIGRISMHEDRDNDGVYEHHSVFVDKLVFPRFLVPFGANSILTMETNGDDVWKYTDTDGDGVADRRELFGSGFGRLANVEHQQSGLFWALDNWMYSTINQFRVRWTPQGLVKEPTASNRSQWGATQDNYGKPYFQAGSSGMPGYFQFPIHYGEFNYPEQFEPGLSTVWGAAVLVADMQGGMPAVRMPDGSLRSGTGAAGNDVYRGDRLPADMVGDYFYGEVVGRVVRRFRPAKIDGLTQMRNVYPQSEFIRSTDPLFRPVDVTTAPDGTLYITDMYHGIIQEAAWTGPGTYLRARIEQYGLDRIIGRGRIWRVRHAGIERDPVQPRLLEETPAQLVTRLAHPNGWWRDTAQQLLVLSQDMSVLPELREMALRSEHQLARIHSLWTLEGLSALDSGTVRTLMDDPDPAIRIQAIRASETLYKAGDRSLEIDYIDAARDADVDVAIQALLTLNVLRTPGSARVLDEVRTANSSAGVQLVVRTIKEPSLGRGRGGTDRGLPPALTLEETEVLDRGRQIYDELCYSCHGVDGRGAPVGDDAAVTRAPALAGSPRVLSHRDFVTRVVLHGLTGPHPGGDFSDVMIPMGGQTDRWIADVASYVRYAFGNHATFVDVDDVARIRRDSADRTSMWTLDELEAVLPRQIVDTDQWRVTANRNAAEASRAITLLPWTAGELQTAGTWLQIELPAERRLTEVQFEASAGDLTPVMGASADAAAAGFVFGGLPDQAKLGYPRAYSVELSSDGQTWTTAVANGRGVRSLTTATFSPTSARYIRIALTESHPEAPQWTVMRLKLFEAVGRP